jgi:hypothetical protein
MGQRAIQYKPPASHSMEKNNITQLTNLGSYSPAPEVPTNSTLKESIIEKIADCKHSNYFNNHGMNTQIVKPSF